MPKEKVVETAGDNAPVVVEVIVNNAPSVRLGNPTGPAAMK
jgi:hypothetical protein